jgi:hypothetical protein
MYKIFSLCSLAAFLSACVPPTPPLTRQQQLAIYRTRCLEYGYEPGTVEFADCMKEQESQQERLIIERKKLSLLEKEDKAARKKRKAKEKKAAQQGWGFEW